ncbi:MAG: hypothetical protein AAF357_10445, partial [Verrucomicrobiota bacterium]
LPEARRKIEEGTVPLGQILMEESVPHFGSPRGFFQTKADDFVSQALDELPGSTLSGRCNELCFEGGQRFADIVEILPRPLPSNPSSTS